MPNPLALLGKLLALGAASKAIRKTADPDDSKWKVFQELKEKLGRKPTFEEFINADPVLSEKEREELIKLHKENNTLGDDTIEEALNDLLSAFKKDLEKLNK